MALEEIARGPSFANLVVTREAQVPVGALVRAVLDLHDPALSWVFDLAGAELVVQRLLPPSLRVLDVYAQGPRGIVELEVVSNAGPGAAVPSALPFILAGVLIRWLGPIGLAVLAGLAIASLVALVRILAEVGRAVGGFIARNPALLAAAGGGLLVAFGLLRRRPKRTP